MTTIASSTFSSDAAIDTYISGLKNAHALEKQATQLIGRQLERIENYPEVEQLCPSSDDLRAGVDFRNGGSGSSGF